MSELTWDRNSKVMYEKLVDSVPRPFRKRVVKKFERAAAAQQAQRGAVTEDFIVDFAKDMTPEPFLGTVMTLLDPLRMR